MNIEIVIEQALWKAESDMPAGQSWNLSSKVACKMLAKHVVAAITDQKDRDFWNNLDQSQCYNSKEGYVDDDLSV
jgi:hypothetical protein